MTIKKTQLWWSKVVLSGLCATQTNYNLLSLILTFSEHVRPVREVLHQLKRQGGFPSLMNTIAKAKALVAKFNASEVAISKLVEKTNKKLIADVTTRWSSTYLMISCLVERKYSVDDICKFLKRNSLLNTDWEILAKLCELLEPFANYTQLTTGSKIPTLPSVFPSFLEVKNVSLRQRTKITYFLSFNKR